MKKIFASVLLMVVSGSWAFGSTPDEEAVKMDRFITDLMNKMTIEEKIGQLHQFSGGDDIVSGEQKVNSPGQQKAEMIRRGEVGTVLNA